MLTNEQVELKVAELEAIVLNKVKFVPFGEIEYKLGYISKVTVDKRTNTILLAIVCEDGSKVYKTPNAKFLEISEEKQENVKSSVRNSEVSLLKAKIAELEAKNFELSQKLSKKS